MINHLEKLIESFTKNRENYFFAVLILGLVVTVVSIIYSNELYASYGLAIFLYSLLANSIRAIFHDIIGKVIKNYLVGFIAYSLIQFLLLGCLFYLIFPFDLI